MRNTGRSCRMFRSTKLLTAIFLMAALIALAPAQQGGKETGKPREAEEIKPEKGYVQGTADEFEEKENEGIIIFRGNVRMFRENGHLFADKVTVYRDPKTGEVLKTIAEGNVDLKDGDLIARCEKAVLNEAEDTIELSGSVVVIRGDDRVEAPYVKYDRKTGVRIGRGGVRFKVKLKEKKGEGGKGKG
ncbi:hypothetical protein DRP77_08960 [Candidatus Poribacteria bacterium]|nr:MAG: hypothetical protein DRP77_08960 [Candidatus Poribacteria bacterium]